MSGEKETKTIFENGYAKGKREGKLEALREILGLEELALVREDDGAVFQSEKMIVESKHIRKLLDQVENTDIRGH